MKSLMIATIIFAAAGAAAPAMAQTSVSISVGQPNFYGRIDLGGYAPPPVYVAQPVIIERQVRYVDPPIYLRVPEGHRKHWRKHCRAYNACGQQVFFVQDGWYNNTYAPRYREQHSREQYRQVDSREFDRGRDEGRDRDDKRGHGNGHDKDKDKDKGKGHDKGKHDN
ncbi:MAG: hypothetical protein H7335_22840 [Massilia sp.]|nr:hypothetical protein [Massilia sp.]